MFGSSKHSKSKGGSHHESHSEYKDKQNRLFNTKPHVPQHQEIELPEPGDGLAWASDMEEHMWAFTCFRNYPNYIQKFNSPGEVYDCGPWCLEQKSDPFLSLNGHIDGPVIGLRYQLYYNSEMSGDIEIQPHLATFSELPEGFREASVYVNIDAAPFIPHDHIFGLLSSCSEPFDRYKEFREPGSRLGAIKLAMIEAMWESNRSDSLWIPLSFMFSGTVCKDHIFK